MAGGKVREEAGILAPHRQGNRLVLFDGEFRHFDRTGRVAADVVGEAHGIHERLKPPDLVVDGVEMIPQNPKFLLGDGKNVGGFGCGQFVFDRALHCFVSFCKS